MHIINCPICGKRISSDIKKCPYCGFEIADYLKKQSETADRNNKQPEAAGRKRRHITFIAGILFSFCVSGIIVISVISCISDHQKSGTINTSLSVSAAVNDETAKDSGTSHDNDIKQENDTVLTDDNFESPAESDSSTEPSSISDASKPSAADIKDLIGVYAGDEHAMLILYYDGKAYYYSNAPAYTDINCTWNVSDNTVNVYLEKLHCTISANVSTMPKLIFESESSNWVSEEYEKLDVDPESYIKREVVTNDPAASVLSDGRLRYCMSGLSFILPKYFCDLDDELDKNEGSSVFIDVDVPTDFTGSVLFNDDLSTYSADLTASGAVDIFSSFASGFVNNPQFSDPELSTVAGFPAYIARLKDATFNKSFFSFTGYHTNGYIAIILNKDAGKNIIVFFCQTADRKRNDSSGFKEILESASVI